MRLTQASAHSVNILAIVTLMAALSCAFAARALAMGELIGDPTKAREFDYCEWAFGDRDSYGSMPDLQAIMKAPAAGESEEILVSAVLLDAGTKIALAARTRKVCERDFRNGRKLFDKTLRRATRSFSKNAEFAPSEDHQALAVQEEVTRLWIADQAARVAYVGLQTDKSVGAAFWARQLSVAHARLADYEATRFMMATLATVDWIDSDRFGVQVSRRAWVLAQHADRQPDFQRQVLQRMEAYLPTGGVSPRDYAYLWDRVAVNTGQLQRFGTQPTWKCEDGELTLQAMEDPGNVDQRRAEMGMGTAASALAEMARNTCR